jgi:fatty acid desaturase
MQNQFSTVEWRDLLKLNKWEILDELCLSLPWLIISWIMANYHLYIFALLFSFMFFLTGLRQVHNAYHYALGIAKKHTEWFMFLMSVLMLGSMHAIQINHLRHHRYCMQEDDIEAMSAKLTWWRAILLGPYFPYLLHKKALEVGTQKQRNWILFELCFTTAWILVVFLFLDISFLRYHVFAMLAGQCLTAFFAVWTVHHDCEPDDVFARTIRGKLTAILTYNMFFHIEHHLFPAVPTRKLDLLAKRLDMVDSSFSKKRVF